jgi:hypothetical protein
MKNMFSKSPLRFLLASWLFITLIGILTVMFFIAPLHKMNRKAAFEKSTKSNSEVKQILKEHFLELQSEIEKNADQSELKSFVSNKQLSNIAQILKRISIKNPEVEILFVSDLAGTNMVVYPNDPSVESKNFAFREWFQAVSHLDQTIVSEVYRTAAFPRPQVVAVSTPIRGVDQKTIAYLTTLIKVETIAGWIKERPDNEIRISLFDQFGNLVTLASNGTSDIENHRHHPVLEKSLTGRSGLFDGADPASGTNSLISYSSIPVLKWNIIASQPKSEVYSEFILGLTTLMWSSLIGLVTIIGFFVWLKSDSQNLRIGAQNE